MSVSPLVDHLLVKRGTGSDPVWRQTGLENLTLAALLPEMA
jgi:hypothetical protein